MTFFIKNEPRIFSNKTHNYPDSKIPYFGHKGLYKLPKIISTIKDITEEQAKSIVEFVSAVNGVGYRDYEIITIVNHKETAKESLQSLIQANGLDITKNYLILKKL